MINPFIQKPSFSSSLSPNSSMALFHSYTLPHQRLLPTLSPFSSKPLNVSLPHSLTTTTHFNNTPLSISTPPRKLLCKPPQGKYVADDYIVKKFSAEEIQELVKEQRDVPIVIDFYATWCGTSVLMAQEIEMLAVEYEGTAMVVKVNTDEEYEFARDMQVRGLPTLLFISPDPEKGAIRTEGLIPIQLMRDIIDKDM